MGPVTPILPRLFQTISQWITSYWWLSSIRKETEVGYSDHTTDIIQEALHDFVLKHLPKFKTAKISHRWAGIMGFSVDGEPLIGSLPEDNQVFFCGGYTGHGIGLAFHCAHSLVDLIYGRSIPDWLSAKRF